MSTKLVNLRIDFAFKQLFGMKGNEGILTGFLNAILEESLDASITDFPKGKAHKCARAPPFRCGMEVRLDAEYH